MNEPRLGRKAAAELFELCAVDRADRSAALELLLTAPSPGTHAALRTLNTRLGRFNNGPATPLPAASESDWINALLRFAPALAQHHAGLGVEPAITAATLADVGAQISIHRRVHGTFGLETWAWLTHHMDGSLLRIGRLQFHLQQTATARGPLRASDWYVGLHIPEDGPLDPAAVDDSLWSAAKFYEQHFADKPVRAASCDSWLLDPHLASALPSSNMSAFARRFTLAALRPEPSDALYFTFRTRNLENVADLPRDTSLQRIVAGHIEADGIWQVGTGWIPWPAPASR